MNCQIRSADRELYSGQARMIVARSARGEFAVMDNHAPLLASLSQGVLRVATSEKDIAFACFGGTLQVDEHRDVTVLVDAVPVGEINPEDIRAQLETLEDAPSSDRLRERLTFLQHVREDHG